MRDIVTLQVHILLLFFCHIYLTLIELTKYKCALFVYWKIMFSNFFLNVIYYISISHFFKEIFILFIVFTHW